MSAWAERLPPPHEVTIVCRCPDPDVCATNALVQDRNTGWKEAFRMRELLDDCLREREAPRG
jgi:hypothetical protein